MTASYTPTAEFTDSATVVADGDAADATNLNLGAKKALDRCAMLRAATDGLLVWSGKARVATGGASSGSTGVYCPPIEAVSLLDGTTWKSFALASETQLTTASHFGGGTLANSTAYYVYAYVSAGALALQISTDAPGSDGIWKTSAVGTHRYLFSFVTDSSGVPIAMHRTGSGRTLYYVSGAGMTTVRVLNAGTATSFTNVDLSALVPATARVVLLHAICTNSSTTAHGQLQIRTDGETAGYLEQGVGVADASNDFRGTHDFTIEASSSRIVEYRRESAAGYASITVSLYVLGYEE